MLSRQELVGTAAAALKSLAQSCRLPVLVTNQVGEAGLVHGDQPLPERLAQCAAAAAAALLSSEGRALEGIKHTHTNATKRCGDPLTTSDILCTILLPLPCMVVAGHRPLW
jgi:hypothetical protein